MEIRRMFFGTWATAAATLCWLLPTLAAVAEMPYFHRQRAPIRCCLPKYNYGHDGTRFTDSAIAVADAIQLQMWLDEYDLPTEYGRRSYGKPPPVTLENFVPRSDSARSNLNRPVQRKPFHFTQAGLTVNHIRLEQVGLSIHDTGHLFASGKITHDGGPDGGMQGSNVVIHLRAYAAPVDQPGQLPINSAMVWQTEHKLWVKRGPSQVISLAGSSSARDTDLRRNFNEITHLEVELEYQPDR